MTQAALFPPVSFGPIGKDACNGLLVEWGHEEGPCNRPFGVYPWGLELDGEIVSIAVSASTPGSSAAGFPRAQCVDLARLCTAPGHADLTRVTLRLWRVVAAPAFKTWKPLVAVTYCRQGKAGHIFRADGWRKWGETRGGKSGPGSQWTPSREYTPKVIWIWRLDRGAAP